MLRAPALLLVLAAGVAQALEAKWTPNGDGPARFSKRYRDAAGIDDSRWATPDEESSWNIFPTTPMGWAMTAVACVVIFVMLVVISIMLMLIFFMLVVLFFFPPV